MMLKEIDNGYLVRNILYKSFFFNLFLVAELDEQTRHKVRYMSALLYILEGIYC
jgi:hypothetical protein